MARRKAEDPSRVRVRVLGASEISVGARRIGMNTEVLFALALYLTTRAGERIAREELLELFWPEGSEEDRRHALRQQMYRLRQKGLEVDDAGELILLDPSRVESDLRAALAEDWWEGASEVAISEACEWGPVFSRHRAPAFHEWLDGVRSVLGQNVRRAALRQIGIARREGRWADLDRWGRAILKTDPLNEEGTLARAESAAMSGSKTIALEIIDNYLMELGDVTPDLGKPVLQMRKRIAERRPDWAMRGPKEVPLVGRTELMTKLTGLVEDVWRGEGRAVVLTGAAGIGKTRLAMEARAYAELKGVRTVKVRSDPASSARPLASLQNLLAQLLELPGAAGCHPDSLQLLKRVLEQSNKLSRPDVSAMMVSVSEFLPDAAVDLCDAITHECRALVLVDDLHHLDSHSFNVLSHIVRATARRRIGWIFTSRDLARTGVALSPESDVAVRHKVAPLAPEFALELAASTSSAHGLRLTSDALDSLVRTSGGNPLFVRELAVSSRNRPVAAGLPESLSLLIEERLSSLSTELRRTLAAIACFGDNATLELLELATGPFAGDSADDLDALESDGIIAVSESRHLVLHECWRQAILDSLSGSSRAAIAKRCADVLSNMGEHRRSTQFDWCAAQLYREAGYSEPARRLYLRAAETLYVNGLPEESVRVVRIARELLRADEESVELQSRLVAGLLASGEHLAAIAESASAVSSLRRSVGTDRAHAATMLCARVDALIRAGRPLEAEIQALAELAADRALPLKQRQGCALMGIVWASNACNAILRERFAAAVETLGEGEQHSLAGLLTRVIFASDTQTPDRVRDAIHGLRSADYADESMYLRCRALRVEARALRELGLDEDARSALTESFDLAQSAHLSFDASISAEALTYMELDANRLDEAEAWLERFVRLTPNKNSYERASSMDHCRDRVLIQRGAVEMAAERLRARVSRLKTDWNLRRKLSELSNFAFAMASVRETTAATEAIAEIRAILDGQHHGLAADYAVEMSCRALRELSRADEANTLAEGHVRSIQSRMARDFAPFHTELRSCVARLALSP